jgi:hypothetical protein
MHQNYQKSFLASRSHNLWLKMTKLKQSKSFANSIVLFLMADIALDCQLVKVD